ncbi:hypothetical protein [Tropicimonas sediminicola]|uniref:Uncharacterized protein n=1 Tax=Tropicimonas sediminicola TaxID=1031541 RepID=A0A239HYQ1_9RHOB|nr:hypothetical protein [Tropicimonas sediminicola]SNS85833.1 hypothetical protein SAMN05421757_10475 [Tropicimonas sediminicola]
MPDKPKSPKLEKSAPVSAKQPPRRSEAKRPEKPAPRPIFTDWASI